MNEFFISSQEVSVFGSFLHYTLLDILLLAFPLNDREMFLDCKSRRRNLAICLPERIFIVLQIYLAMPDIVLSGC